MSISPELENELENIAVQWILEGNRSKNVEILKAGAELYACLQPDSNERMGADIGSAMRDVGILFREAHQAERAARAAQIEEFERQKEIKLTDDERKAKAEKLITNRLNASLASSLCAEASKLQSMLETGAVPPGILTRLGLAEGRQSFTADEQNVMRARVDALKAKAAELLAEMDDPAIAAGNGYLAI